MARMGSFWGRLLRIDLTAGKSSYEELDKGVLGQFLGGRGLGAWIAYKEIRPSIDPLEPENKLIFSTGPLTATAAPGSSKYVVTTKSPLTGIYLMSISSRDFAREIKKCGIDAIIIEGKAPRPSYLLIREGRVEIRDATHLWGTTTKEAELVIQSEAGLPRPSVACIGPAGERMDPYASIMNNGGRAAGRGGAGAVMGSKNLKAISIYGSTKVEVVEAGAFQQELKKVYQNLDQHTLVKTWRDYGTFATIGSNHTLGIMPVNNWRNNQLENVNFFDGDRMREKYLIRSTRCSPCPASCSKLCIVKDGQFAGLSSEGPEYETVYSFGSACGITDLETVMYADNFCDQYGIDTMSSGVSIAFLMECFERGLITKGDLGGLEPRFGNAAVIPRLLHDMARAEGIGKFLLQGTRAMAHQIGQGSIAFAMQVKGMELGGYDARSAKGMALVYACGPRGGCHHAGGRPIAEEIRTKTQLIETGKGKLVKDSREDRVIFDSAVICALLPLNHSEISELVSTAIGLNIGVEELYKIAERTSNLERMFNIREGIRREHDTLPDRLLNDRVSEGPSKGQTVNLNVMLDDFYQVCGWDKRTGIPTETKLNELSLASL